MPPFALTVLKWAFLALLYFFVYRAIRWAAFEMFSSVSTRED